MPTKHSTEFPPPRSLSLSLSLSPLARALPLSSTHPGPGPGPFTPSPKKRSTWHILIRQEIGNYGTSFCDSLLFERACDRETGVFEEDDADVARNDTSINLSTNEIAGL